jgi:hypothetical protein
VSDRPEDIPYLHGLAARLRSLATMEPKIAEQLRQMADETDDRANAMALRHRPRDRSV